MGKKKKKHSAPAAPAAAAAASPASSAASSSSSCSSSSSSSSSSSFSLPLHIPTHISDDEHKASSASGPPSRSSSSFSCASAAVAASSAAAPTSRPKKKKKKKKQCGDPTAAAFNEFIDCELDNMIDDVSRSMEKASAKECATNLRDEQIQMLLVSRERAGGIVARRWQALLDEPDKKIQLELVQQVIMSRAEVQQIVDWLLKSNDEEKVELGLAACKLVETLCQKEDWRLLWTPSALRLLDSPCRAVRLQSVLTLAEARDREPCKFELNSDDASRLVATALEVLSPYGTPDTRRAAVIIFRGANAAQIPDVLPLLVGFSQQGYGTAACHSIGAIVSAHSNHLSLSQYGVVASVVPLLQQARYPKVSAKACWLLLLMLVKSTGAEQEALKDQIIRADFLTFQTVQPLLTHPDVSCRSNMVLLLFHLQTAVAASPLMADDAFLRLLLQPSLAGSDPRAVALCRLLVNLIKSATREDKPRFTKAALEVLTPYDTADKRRVVAICFRGASPEQLPVVLPLLVGFLQHGDESECLINSCASITILVHWYHPPLSQYGVAASAVALLRHAVPEVSAQACWLLAYMLQESSDEERPLLTEQMIQARLLTLPTLEPLLTHCDANCRENTGILLRQLHTAVAASSLRGNDAFFGLLLNTLLVAASDTSLVISLCVVFVGLVEFASPKQQSDLVAAVLECLSPADTNEMQRAAARIFRYASAAQLPLVLPLLADFLQRENEPNWLTDIFLTIRTLVETHHPPHLSQSGLVAPLASLLFRAAPPELRPKACSFLAVMLQESSDEERQLLTKQMKQIQVGLLTVETLEPLLTHPDVKCRENAVYLLSQLPTAALVASPLMAGDGTFFSLLLDTVVRNLLTSNRDICVLLMSLIDSLTPDRKSNLVASMLDILSPYDTAPSRLLASLCFRGAAPAQLSVVTPLLIEFLQHEEQQSDCLFATCNAIRTLTPWQFRLEAATRVVPLLQHHDSRVSGEAGELIVELQLVHQVAIATPAQRQRFLSLLPPLLERIDFNHAPASNQQKCNWNILVALVEALEWEECSMEGNQMHPLVAQLRVAVMPQLEEMVQRASPIHCCHIVQQQLWVADLLQRHVYSRPPVRLPSEVDPPAPVPAPGWFAARVQELKLLEQPEEEKKGDD